MTKTEQKPTFWNRELTVFIERLTAERDVTELHRVHAIEIAHDCRRRLVKAEAQSNKAVGLLQQQTRRPCVTTGDYPFAETGKVCALNCIPCQTRDFLASLSTVTPDRPSDEELAPSLAAYRAGRMRPWDEVKKELGIKDQPCERVKRSSDGGRYEWHECYRHGCGWPDEGECPATIPSLLTKGQREDGQ